MTPDTAALRALADSAGMFVRLDPDTVRALCDAADEVERLRALVDFLDPFVEANDQLGRALIEARAEVERLRAAVDRHVQARVRVRRALRAAVAERDADRRRIAAVLALCDEADEPGWDDTGTLATSDIRYALALDTPRFHNPREGS